VLLRQRRLLSRKPTLRTDEQANPAGARGLQRLAQPEAALPFPRNQACIVVLAGVLKGGFKPGDRSKGGYAAAVRLLGSFPQDALPAFSFAVFIALFPSAHQRAVRDHRHAARHTNFGPLLQDPFKLLPLGQAGVEGNPCFWLACGRGAHPDLFGVLWRHLPLFNLIDKPGKYFGPPAAIFLCLLAGVAVSAIALRLRPKTGRILAAGLLLIAAPFPLAVHLQCRKTIEYLPPDFLPHPLPGGGFYQVENRAGLDRPLDPRNRAAPYYNYKRGVGTIAAWVPVDLPRRAIPRYFIVWPEGLPVPNPAYRGEIEGPPGEKAKGKIDWEPNRITVALDRPPSETVVINRNYDPDWRCAEGEVVDRDGRLAVIPSGTAGREFRLNYLPRTLPWGAAASLLAAAAWLIAARVKFNRE